MRRITAVTFVLVFSAVARGAAPAAAKIDESLEAIRNKHELPALAAVVIRDGKVIAVGAVGVRSATSDVHVTIDDRFHLGSDTKAMTATLAAVLVERGKISFSTTIAQALPGLKDQMRAEYRQVTLAQLLQHQSGIGDAGVPPIKLRAFQGPMRSQRIEASKLILAQAPAVTVGSKMIYSNHGYIVAGAMLEAAADKGWEDLMREEIFKPLKMESAGFGAPGNAKDAANPDNALGHLTGADGKLSPMLPSLRGADNPAVLGPAGIVHATMIDWARFVQLHLAGARGERTAILSPATFKLVHTPAKESQYAMGWLVVPRPWSGGVALTHAGSNTLWYCVTWIAPEKNFAVLIATNRGGEIASRACDAAAAMLIKQFLVPTAKPADR